MGAYDPNFNYGGGPAYNGPSWVGDSIFNAADPNFGPNVEGIANPSRGVHLEALPGSFDQIGRGSGGSLNSGSYDLMGELSKRAMLAGRDPGLGLEGTSAIQLYGQHQGKMPPVVNFSALAPYMPSKAAAYGPPDRAGQGFIQ